MNTNNAAFRSYGRKYEQQRYLIQQIMEAWGLVVFVYLHACIQFSVFILLNGVVFLSGIEALSLSHKNSPV